MKPYLIFLLLSLAGCDQEDDHPSIIIDSTLCDSLSHHIQFVSDRHFSKYKTLIEARFFANGIQQDSIIEKAFSMISWYSIHKDTIDLVAHVGHFETEALLVRFVGGKPTVRFFRAGHEVGGPGRFRLTPRDSFVETLEIIPQHFQLSLCKVPDTLHKQPVLGHIDMQSGFYYDRRDSVQQPRHVHLQFYFRSQYRDFGF